MLEQAGGLYNQLAINIVTPSNSTYKRLWQNLLDGLWYLRKSDGTDELFTNSLLVSSTIGGTANVGWTNNSTQMAVTAAYQIIVGPAATRYSSSSEFVQNTANALEIKYIGANNAVLRIEMDDTHVASGTGFATFAIFKNNVIIADSEFQALLNVSRNLGRSITIELSANTNDIFDIRVLAAAPINATFRYISLIVTKLKQN